LILSLQYNFDQLDFEDSIERIQQDMAKAIGVPYVLLKSGNNANIDANQKLFYLHTVLPILNQFCSAFAHFFNNGVNIIQIGFLFPPYSQITELRLFTILLW
jgi:hypothetical protein